MNSLQLMFAVLALVTSTFVQKPAVQEEHAQVTDNVFVSSDRPKLKVTLAREFKYIGKFPFDIRGIAGGYRYVWGETDHGQHLRRVFIVQAEGYYPSNNGTYQYGAPNPATLAGEVYQHNVFFYDDAKYIREDPGTEAGMTREFFEKHGLQWDTELVMSRFARVVDGAKKNEIIFFYFENLKDHTARAVGSFSEDGGDAEQKRIEQTVEANSLKAFTVTR